MSMQRQQLLQQRLWQTNNDSRHCCGSGSGSQPAALQLCNICLALQQGNNRRTTNRIVATIATTQS